MTVHWAQEPYDNTMSYRRRIGAFARFAVRAGRRAAGLAADVVVATSTPLTIALPGLYAARRRGVPMVFEVRDLWPAVPIAMGALRNRVARTMARGLEQLAYRGAEEVIALSPGMAAGVVAAGVDSARVTVIPNACDFEVFQVPAARGAEFRARYSWLGNRPLVTYTGAVSTANDVGWLVELAAAVAKLHAEIRFVVVGRGREWDAVAQRARRLGVLDTSFFLLPPVEHHRVPEILSAADLAAVLFAGVPELRTSSPNKAFDAMAAGRGLLMNFEGFIANRVREYGAGLCLDRDDLVGSATAVTRLLRDREAIVRAGRAATRIGREHFDRDRLVERLEEVLLRITDRARARR
jgi:glycosyltransferase involved in cell wall biosynthesis